MILYSRKFDFTELCIHLISDVNNKKSIIRYWFPVYSILRDKYSYNIRYYNSGKCNSILCGQIFDFMGYFSHIISEVTNMMKVNSILCTRSSDFTSDINSLKSEVTSMELIFDIISFISRLISNTQGKKGNKDSSYSILYELYHINRTYRF